MGVPSRGAAVERTTSAVERDASARESIRQHIVCQRHDLVSSRMNIAMHVADEMANARSLGEVARMHDENVFVCCTDDVGSFRVMVEKLPGMQNRAGWQFEREHDTIGRLDETPHATAIDSVHRQFNDWQAGRRLGVRMEHSHGNGS
jgi:hypothetical protein